MTSPSTSPIICRQARPEDFGRLSGFLAADQGNLIYATPEFAEFLRQATASKVEILLALSGDEILGALPFAICDAPGLGQLVNSLPWWGSHGGVWLDRGKSNADAVRIALLRAFEEEMRGLQPLGWTVILSPDEEPSKSLYADVLNPNIIEDRVGQITSLPEPGESLEERLIASFEQKTRNLVRKSLKQDFTELVSDEDWAWDFLFQTHTENIAALGGRSKPREHFTAIRATFPPNMRRLTLAMDGEAPAAGMLTLSFNGTVEYLTPAVRVEQRTRQPLSFLILRGMQHEIENDARFWNWGGTWISQRSLHHFKAGFGAIDRPYSYLIGASPGGMKLFRERKSELGSLFPYFYTYPYAMLDDPT